MTEVLDAFILRGQTLAYRDDPFIVGPDAATQFDSDGAVVVDAGKIREVGPAESVIASNSDLHVEYYPNDLIMAGFVDCHAHYPQYEVIASYGEELLEWLEKYTFPAELKFADPVYARVAAEFFLDDCLRNGTTTASVYSTVHPESVDAFFTAAKARSMRMATGKVMMDRNAPDGVTDTAQSGYDQSKQLIDRWHGHDRLTYVVSPRFAVTSTAEQLEAAGALWKEHPTALMQTHIDENQAEIELVRNLFPDAPDYFGVYERFGLVGPGANMGHAIHLTERERRAFADTGTAISHCPTSNLFLGSGLMDMKGLREGSRDVPIGLGSDIGGGTSLSMFATMRAAYEVSRLNGFNLHPAKAYYLATVGSATVMRMNDRIGNLAPGYDADIIVVDLNSTAAIAHRNSNAQNHWEALFIQMILADDRAIRTTIVNGQVSYRRD